jgi:hypothetical protein
VHNHQAVIKKIITAVDFVLIFIILKNEVVAILKEKSSKLEKFVM